MGSPAYFWTEVRGTATAWSTWGLDGALFLKVVSGTFHVTSPLG